MRKNENASDKSRTERTVSMHLWKHALLLSTGEYPSMSLYKYKNAYDKYSTCANMFAPYTKLTNVLQLLKH